MVVKWKGVFVLAILCKRIGKQRLCNMKIVTHIFLYCFPIHFVITQTSIPKTPASIFMSELDAKAEGSTFPGVQNWNSEGPEIRRKKVFTVIFSNL